MARRISTSAGGGHRPEFVVNDAGLYRDDWAWLPGSGSVINAKFNAPDGPICSDLREAGALLRRERGLHAQLPAFVAVEGQGDLPLHAAVVHRDGSSRLAALAPSGEREDGASAPKGEGAVEAQRFPLSPLPRQLRLAASPPEGEGQTLRQLAMRAIADTRFVPEKGRNRIGSMVEGRPDWVISRQRAWGVPIALFVERKTQARWSIRRSMRELSRQCESRASTRWSEDNAAHLLGNHNPDDYERSATSSTLVRQRIDPCLRAGERALADQHWPADLYLEGSTSTAAGSSRRCSKAAPPAAARRYNAVLTHGFTMDPRA